MINSQMSFLFVFPGGRHSARECPLCRGRGRMDFMRNADAVIISAGCNHNVDDARRFAESHAATVLDAAGFFFDRSISSSEGT